MAEQTKQRRYLVVGIYEDNHQRYANEVEAESPEDAERRAQEICREENGYEESEYEPLIIAGVIAYEEGASVEVVARAARCK